MAKRFSFGKKSASIKFGNIRLGTRSSSFKIGGINFNSKAYSSIKIPKSSTSRASSTKEITKKLEQIGDKITKLDRYYTEFAPLEEIHKTFYIKKTDKEWNDELQSRNYNINGSEKWEELLKLNEFSISEEEKKELYSQFEKKTFKTGTLFLSIVGIITMLVCFLAKAHCCLPFLGIVLFLISIYLGSLIDKNNVTTKVANEIEALKKKFNYDETTRLEELKKSLEDNEPKRIEHVKKLLEGDMEVINNLLSDVLNNINYPKETLIDFAILDKESIFLDIDLPEIEDMPTEKLNISATGRHTEKTMNQKEIRKLYATVVHGIALSLASIVFSSIPTCKKVILSGYTQRTNKKTGNQEDEYVYSIVINKEIFYSLNIPNVDPIEAFDNFENKRNLTKTFILNTIEPYEIK